MSPLRQPAVGAYLRAARARSGVSLAEASSRSLCPEDLIASAELGVLPISLLDAAILLRVYGENPANLTAFRGPKPPPPKPPKTALGRILRAGREAKGLTPEGLAHQTGEALSRVQSWEGGSQVPTSYQLAILVRVLGLDASEVLEAILNPNLAPLENP